VNAVDFQIPGCFSPFHGCIFTGVFYFSQGKALEIVARSLRGVSSDKFYLVFNIFVVLFKGYIHLSIQFIKGDDYGF